MDDTHTLRKFPVIASIFLSGSIIGSSCSTGANMHMKQDSTNQAVVPSREITSIDIDIEGNNPHHAEVSPATTSTLKNSPDYTDVEDHSLKKHHFDKKSLTKSVLFSIGAATMSGMLTGTITALQGSSPAYAVYKAVLGTAYGAVIGSAGAYFGYPIIHNTLVSASGVASIVACMDLAMKNGLPCANNPY